MSSRPPNVRSNDPRFKQQDQSQADEIGRNEKEMSSSNLQLHRIQDAKRQKQFGDSRFGDSEPVPDNTAGGNLTSDPFGRSWDWKDRPFGSRPGNTTPRSSPVKQANLRPFSSAVQKEKVLPHAPVLSFTLDKTKMATLSIDGADTSSVRKKGKSEQAPPLFTHLLGDESVIKRAKSAMGHLSDVVSSQAKVRYKLFSHDTQMCRYAITVSPFLAPQLDTENFSVLPTKQVIMSAVTKIEKLIKESQKESEHLQDEKTRLLIEEESQRREEVERLAEGETNRRIEKERVAAEKMLEEESMRVSALKKVLEKSKDIFSDAKAKLEREFDDHLSQAKGDERRQLHLELESRLSLAAVNFEKDISKAKRELEKAKTSFQMAEANAATAESEYKSVLKNEGVSEVVGEPAIEPLSKTSELIHTITSNNKRSAAEAQKFSISLVSDNADTNSERELSLQKTTDPRYYRTHEEWSAITTQILSLNDALYSEPSESPYFANSEKRHSVVGLSVKEYIRDRQKRLLDQWTELAEEYEVRRRLYEKQQKKLAKRGQQRGSTSVAGKKSILGEKKAIERAGLDRGGNILESTGRSSNNPYRRARRGNEVRSEYEQEQIIAELAAKEAMEKRITHGGSLLPRQICRLERVSRPGINHSFSPLAHYILLLSFSPTATYSILRRNLYSAEDR
jgi:hypothetical protein